MILVAALEESKEFKRQSSWGGQLLADVFPSLLIDTSVDYESVLLPPEQSWDQVVGSSWMKPPVWWIWIAFS